MRLKRTLLIVSLLVFSFVCIYMMNDSYDRLARYQYEITAEQREILESHLSDDDISYIIQQKIKPEQLMNYISLNGFDVRNTLYYEVCEAIRPMDKQAIVNFVNTYKKHFTFTTLELLVQNYDYTMLSEFYDGEYSYIEEAKLLVDPSLIDVNITEEETVYKYQPDGLALIGDYVVPTASIFPQQQVQLKSEVVEPLTKLCEGLKETNNTTCGGLILVSGYISYENQISLYNEAIVKYGVDNFKKYADYPGQSYSQLGYTLRFVLSQTPQEQFANSEQAKWLLANAKKYGFEVLYGNEKEDQDKKVYQPFTLRYVGVDEVEKANDETKEVAKD